MIVVQVRCSVVGLCARRDAAAEGEAEAEEQPRKRGKEEADEDDDIFGYGATDPARGEAWTEEQDLRVSWLRFERRILVLDF